jgi:hypothetical protein
VNVPVRIKTGNVRKVDEFMEGVRGPRASVAVRVRILLRNV